MTRGATPWNPAVARKHLEIREHLEGRGIRVCVGCGCTEDNACCRLPDGTTTTGCHWISATRCSECPPPVLSQPQADMMVRAKRWGGICPGSAGTSTARSLHRLGLLHRPHMPGGKWTLTQAGAACEPPQG